MKRHTCIICKSKRNENYMINVFGNSWACEFDKKYRHISKPCYCHRDIVIMKKMILLKNDLKILSVSNFLN